MYLLIDKKDDHIRRVKDSPFNYVFDDDLNWYQDEKPGLSEADYIKNYPFPIIKKTESGSDIWYNKYTDKWYFLKDRKVHAYKFDKSNKEIIFIFDSIENMSEEYNNGN